jgi:hypothetical protein
MLWGQVLVLCVSVLFGVYLGGYFDRKHFLRALFVFVGGYVLSGLILMGGF